MNEILEQLRAIIDKDLPLMSNLANASALLNQLDNINWCGFYLRDGDVLYLGPFQGEVACLKIPLNRGVCGKAAHEKTTIIVANVHEFKDHIACSSLSKSEIVVPIINHGIVKAVIDIDSPVYDRFHEKEQSFLEAFAEILNPLFD